MQPEVSIIMPVYNAELYLDETLRSIVSQSMKSWELIAVDDFSTDASYDILKRWSCDDDRVKVSKNVTKGILPALTTAYEKSIGAYITRMDADDIMHIDRIKKLHSTVQGNLGSVSVGKVDYFASGKQLAEGYKIYAQWLNDMIDNQDHYTHIYKECVIPSPCWMMHRSDFDRIGGFENGQYPEDYDMVFRLYEYGIKVIGVDTVLHHWRDHQARASRNDENYADQGFLKLKLDYFFKLDRKVDLPLILWGAGRSGKEVAKALLKRGFSFSWITDNREKIGKDIYGVTVEAADLLQSVESAQIITAIRTKGWQKEYQSLLAELGKRGVDIIDLY